jgi:hypothetical protein
MILLNVTPMTRNQCALCRAFPCAWNSRIFAVPFERLRRSFNDALRLEQLR